MSGERSGAIVGVMLRLMASAPRRTRYDAWMPTSNTRILLVLRSSQDSIARWTNLSQWGSVCRNMGSIEKTGDPSVLTAAGCAGVFPREDARASSHNLS